MTTRTEKFQRKPRDADAEPSEAEEILRFPPEEEAVRSTHTPFCNAQLHYICWSLMT